MAMNAEATVTLSLLDRLSGPIKRITGRLADMGKAAGLTGLGKALGGVGRGITDLGSSLARTAFRATSLATALTASGVGLTMALFHLSKGTAEAVKEIGNLSQVSGLHPIDFQRWAFAASTVGISAEKTADILKDVGDKMGDYFQNASGPMKDFFENIPKKVGKSQKQLQKEFKGLSSGDALKLYVKYLEKANLSQSEMTFYMEAIANDATLLLPILKGNGKELDRLGTIAGKAGIIFGETAITLSKEFTGNLQGMEARFKGFRDLIGFRLIPVFNDLVIHINELMDANAGLIRQKIDEYVKRFAHFLRDLINPASELRQRIDAVVTAVTEFFTKVDEKTGETGFQKVVREISDAVKIATDTFKIFSDMVGGPANAAMILIAGWVLAPTILAVTNLATAFGKLALELGKISVSAVTGVMNAIAEFGGGVVTGAMQAAGSANGELYGKAFSLAARLAIIAGIALITAEVLKTFDPKGNLGGITSGVDDWIRSKLGLEKKDTGVTPAELWQGGKNWWNGNTDGAERNRSKDAGTTTGDAKAASKQAGMDTRPMGYRYEPVVKPPSVNVTPPAIQTPAPPEPKVVEPKTLSPVALDLGFADSKIPEFRDPVPSKPAAPAADTSQPVTIPENMIIREPKTVTVTAPVSAPISINVQSNATPEQIGAAVQSHLDTVNRKNAADIQSSLSD